MTNDWNEVARALKHEVQKHGGFLTIQKEDLRERFDVGRLTEGIAEELLETLEEEGLFVFPHPYHMEGASLRIYDAGSEIGRIAQAVADTQAVPETALVDAVNLYQRAAAAKEKRSAHIAWLRAFDVFLQFVIGRTPADWEDLDDERENFQLLAALADSLGLPADIVHAAETRKIAGAIWACRPRVSHWEGAPPELAAILGLAAEKQKDIFDRLLRNAAKYLLGSTEIPAGEVDLGRLGLRYRCEA